MAFKRQKRPRQAMHCPVNVKRRREPGGRVLAGRQAGRGAHRGRPGAPPPCTRAPSGSPAPAPERGRPPGHSIRRRCAKEGPGAGDVWGREGLWGRGGLLVWGWGGVVCLVWHERQGLYGMGRGPKRCRVGAEGSGAGGRPRRSACQQVGGQAGTGCTRPGRGHRAQRACRDGAHPGGGSFCGTSSATNCWPLGGRNDLSWCTCTRPSGLGGVERVSQILSAMLAAPSLHPWAWKG